MVSLYDAAGKRAGKDPQSVRAFVARQVIFSDLVEIALDDGDEAAIDCLAGLVRNNRLVRNAKAADATGGRP